MKQALQQMLKERKRPRENKPKTIKKMVTGSCAMLCLVTQSCPTLYNPMDCSMPGLPVHHQLLELAQTHVHHVADENTEQGHVGS